MRFDTLHAWLDWQQTLHPKNIELGLDRVREVFQRLPIDRIAQKVITVAGTNGKGSTVAFYESWFKHHDIKVASYTSPHVLRYNERIRFDAIPVTDSQLCEAFEVVDQARVDTALTYFEFGTLAAIDLFRSANPDLVIMEVGLGGRLDAVNIMQPDVAVITSIAIDHTDWLGSDRNAIGFEKAGIMRAGCPAICGDADPPKSLLDQASNTGAVLKLIGRHFGADPGEGQWNFFAAQDHINALPMPALRGEFQLANAATALMALMSLPGPGLDTEAIRRGLTDVQLPGRFQTLQARPEVIVDVAHNTAAAASLAAQLRDHGVIGSTHAVIAMLEDKPVDEVVAQVAPEIDYWYTAGLESVPRGLSAKAMAAAVDQCEDDVKLSTASSVASACEQALSAADNNDRIIIFGSFYTVAEAMRYFTHQVQ